MAITLQTEARRIYFVGDTFAIKDKIKSLGGHWDGDRRAWWIGSGKTEEATQLIAACNAPASAVATSEKPKVSDDSKVVAKAKYKGRTYYVLWMGMTRSGTEKARLTVLDGSIDFWADLSACEIVKRYQPREHTYRGHATTQYTTLGGIRRFIEEQREGERTGNICAECGKAGDLVRDLEDGAMKHRHCCDIEP
jgi:hypothetical protein